MNSRARATIAFLLLVVLILVAPIPARARASSAEGVKYPVWLWPTDERRAIASPYRAPAHEYGAGHRGMDLATTPGAVIRAPADGTIAFRGTVVDRPLITIEHPGGYVSTFEPLSSELSPGDTISSGQVIGTVAAGGHAAPGTLHLGVRMDGAYINPLLLFGAVPRAVLLPCCTTP